MNLIIALQHRGMAQAFIIKPERDGIFIAYRKPKRIREETIFLTKSGGLWVGDTADKKLVAKLGREIDAAYPLEAPLKRARPR